MKTLEWVAVALVLVAAEPGRADTLAFHCVFEKFSDENAAQQRQDKPMELRYVVDTKAGKAYLVSDLGSNEVAMTTGSFGMTFIEILETGAVQTVTLNRSTAQAVHSRHTLMGKETWPSQFYGSCTDH